MGILNKGAGVLAPIVFTALVLSDMSQFTEEHISALDEAVKINVLNELSVRLISALSDYGCDAVCIGAVC